MIDKANSVTVRLPIGTFASFSFSSKLKSLCRGGDYGDSSLNKDGRRDNYDNADNSLNKTGQGNYGGDSTSYG